MSGEQEPGGFEVFAEGKALVVLYDFHALRFPAMPVHRNRLSGRIRQYELVPRDATHPPEAVLTRRGLSVMAKSLAISRQFQDMLRSRAWSPEDAGAYDTIVGLCEGARQNYQTESELADEAGRPMPTEEILPPRHVVDAMADDFVVHRRKHCPPLEAFIAEPPAA